ncbi:MAG: hypothetical protein HC897_03595 [Thermoanaerobaculia bacterium]|nr:hypothetical protein [Thermoanaerobaculia bacterium]
MIRVDRLRLDGGQPIQPSENWFHKAATLSAQAITDGASHEIADHYRDPEVKAALEKLFHDKCAYCESRPSADNPWDVEHFRPKGRVAERKEHPGYYWLAYAWENLYPSCVFCNQNRKDAPRWNDPTTSPAQGKLDQFPVVDEMQRAMAPGAALGQEKPLLIDPCAADDDPETHFTYDAQGQIVALDPNDPRAVETIRICHLERRRLRDDRARILIRVVKILHNLRLAKQVGNAMAKQFLEEALADYVAADALYAGIARAAARDPDAYFPAA